MIAKISTAKSMKAVIDYNEKKVEKGEARIIGGENMRSSKDADKMSYEQKLGRFEDLIAGKRNTQHEQVAFHASLSLDPTEKPTDNELRAIASKYMEHMGYGRQPFLIYRHEDTHHPHIHIVSTSVDREGKKINDSNNRYKSEDIRKEIEKEFGLIVAQDKKKVGIDELIPVEMLKGVQYGKTEIKKAISDIVRPVVKEFKLTSMKDLQAVLSQYNVKAETVSGEGKNGKYEGLVFSVTDENGKRVGTGIKASELYSKTSMHNLNLKFEHNKEPKKEIAKETIKAIEKVFASHHSISKEDLQTKLAKAGINLQYHEGTKGVFGITIIDNVNKAVFKGSELGKGYSWNILQSRLSDTTVEKRGIDLLDKETVKKGNSVLGTIFDKLKKDEQTGAYFESQMIRKLPLLDLVSPLLKQMPALDRQAADGVVKGFVEYKHGRLAEIELKEKDYFKAGVGVVMNFLDQSPKSLSPADRVAFLNKHGYRLQSGSGGLVITHSEGTHLQVGLPAEMSLRHFGGLLPVANEKLPAYSKVEKAFIKSVADGKMDTKELDLFTFRYSQFKPLLSEENAKGVATHLTRKFAGETLALLQQPGQSAIELVKELDKRGLQIVATEQQGKAKEYRLQYYTMPEGSVGLNEAFKNRLERIDYKPEMGKPTAKYSVLTGLYQSLDRKDASGIERALGGVEMRNPLLSSALRTEVFPILQRAAGSEGAVKEKMERSAILHLIDRIEKYPTNTLMEVKQGMDKDLSQMGARGEEEFKKKANGGTADGDDGGVESDHRKNKKRGPRLK